MLRFIDGFDSYATADITKKWTSITGSPTVSAGNGRRSSASCRVSTGSTSLALTLDNQQTWTVGLALRFAALPSTAVAIVRWLDSATVQDDLALLNSGFLTVRRNGVTVLGTSSLALSINTTYYLEWRLLVHGTTGQTDVLVNGASWLALTSLNTQQSANAYAAILQLGQVAGNNMGIADLDDVYVCDGTGSAPHNTYLGDCRVDTLLPNADGSAQQWTPSTPGTHYTLVDEAAPNTTDYVSSSTVGQRDTYGMQDLTAQTGTIYGVQLSLAALKSDAGARSIKPLLLSGASEALGAATTLSTSQTYTRHVQTTDPATAAPWTEAGINAAQAGAEVA